MSFWGIMAGLVSGTLTALFNQRILFWYIGIPFAVLLMGSAWLWARRFLPGSVSVSRGIGAWALCCVAPLASIFGTILVGDRIDYLGAAVLGPAWKRIGAGPFGLSVAGLLPSCIWTICLAVAIALFAQRWDWHFVWQMSLGGACVWALDPLSERLHIESNYVFIFLGLLISSFLVGLSLDRLVRILHAADSSAELRQGA